MLIFKFMKPYGLTVGLNVGDRRVVLRVGGGAGAGVLGGKKGRLVVGKLFS